MMTVTAYREATSWHTRSDSSITRMTSVTWLSNQDSMAAASIDRVLLVDRHDHADRQPGAVGHRPVEHGRDPADQPERPPDQAEHPQRGAQNVVVQR